MQESFGKRIWRLAYPLLTYTGISYLLSFLFLIVCYIWVLFNDNVDVFNISPDINNMITDLYNRYINEASAIIFICTIPLLVLYMHMDKKRKTGTEIYKIADKVSWYKYIILPILGASVCVAGTFMIIIGGWNLNGINNIDESFFCGKTAIELITLGILYPVMNELLFRGLLYNRVKEFMSMPVAAVLVSFFCAFYCNSITQGIYAFVMSLISIYVYDRYHTITAPILLNCGAGIIAVLEKEEGILSIFYSSWGRFVTVTIVMCAVIIVMILGIEKSAFDNRDEESAKSF